MKGLSYSSLRVGKQYYAINHGEKYEFTLMEIITPSEFRLKDIHTLEYFYMSDIIRFGKGNDFEIRELHEII
jgi:hypothetical protein